MSDSNEKSEKPQVQTDDTKTSVRYKNAGRSAFAQVLALLIQNWLLFIIGLEMSIATVVIGALHRNPAEALNMNDDQASWVGSISSFCHPIGSLVSGLFQERFGRRGSTILINIPIFAAWLLLYFANSITSLYVVSTIMGLTIGLAEAPLHSYIGEIGEPHLRGTLSTITTLTCCAGGFTMYVMGYFFDWRTVALICSAFPVFGFLLMTQIPESPSWLIVKNRMEDAEKALCWLRGWVQPEEVEKEFQALVTYTRNSARLGHVRSENSVQSNEVDHTAKIYGYLKTQLRKLTDKSVLHPLRLVFIVFVFSAIACVVGMDPYMIHELNDLKSPIDSKLVLVILTVSFFVGAMANVVVLRRFGKRKLALFSNGLSAVCIFGVGIHCSFFKGSVLYPQLAWIPIILFIVNSFLCGLSLRGLPWQLVCEVFPLTARGTGTGISAAWSHFVEFILVKSFLYIETLIDLSGVMYFYGGGIVLGIVYFYFYLPETEGKTLAQIESYFTDDHDRKEKFSIGKSGMEVQCSS